MHSKRCCGPPAISLGSRSTSTRTWARPIARGGSVCPLRSDGSPPGSSKGRPRTTGVCSMTDTGQDEETVRHALKEIARQERLVDQMLTMQARLRDRDRVVGTLIVCTVLIASLVGVAFAFAGSGPALTLLGVTAARPTWLGWLAV